MEVSEKLLISSFFFEDFEPLSAGNSLVYILVFPSMYFIPIFINCFSNCRHDITILREGACSLEHPETSFPAVFGVCETQNFPVGQLMVALLSDSNPAH